MTLQTVRRAIQRGALADYRSGTNWLVSRKSPEAWTPTGHRPKKVKRPYRRGQPLRQEPRPDS